MYFVNIQDEFEKKEKFSVFALILKECIYKADIAKVVFLQENTDQA